MLSIVDAITPLLWFASPLEELVVHPFYEHEIPNLWNRPP